MQQLLTAPSRRSGLCAPILGLCGSHLPVSLLSALPGIPSSSQSFAPEVERACRSLELTNYFPFSPTEKSRILTKIRKHTPASGTAYRARDSPSSAQHLHSSPLPSPEVSAQQSLIKKFSMLASPLGSLIHVLFST